MDKKVALFSEQLGRRIKNTVEDSEKIPLLLPADNQARLLAGHTSPVEIIGAWVIDGGTWKCRARRLWRIDGAYQPIDDGITFDLYHPTSSTQPEQGIGERVFAVFRGVWELISGAGGTVTMCTVILPICRAINPNAKADYMIPFGWVERSSFV